MEIETNATLEESRRYHSIALAVDLIAKQDHPHITGALAWAKLIEAYLKGDEK
jgi:hypothetical protein